MKVETQKVWDRLYKKYGYTQFDIMRATKRYDTLQSDPAVLQMLALRE